MWWITAILLILSPGIFYGLRVVLVAIGRGRCAACGKLGLKMANFIRASIVVEGKRAPDYWSYLDCKKCGTCFKSHRGKLNIASADEKEQYVRPFRNRRRN